MNDLNKRLLTVKEFCQMARISRTTLHRHMKQGTVPYTKIGGRVLIASKVIDSLAEAAGEQDEE